MQLSKKSIPDLKTIWHLYHDGFIFFFLVFFFSEKKVDHLAFVSLSMMLQLSKLLICRKNDELRKDAVDALCCLAHALGEDFTIFIPSIHKLLLKHRLRVHSFPEYFYYIMIIYFPLCV